MNFSATAWSKVSSHTTWGRNSFPRSSRLAIESMLESSSHLWWKNQNRSQNRFWKIVTLLEMQNQRRNPFNQSSRPKQGRSRSNKPGLWEKSYGSTMPLKKHTSFNKLGPLSLSLSLMLITRREIRESRGDPRSQVLRNEWRNPCHVSVQTDRLIDE